jgi:hypothetical protein
MKMQLSVLIYCKADIIIYSNVTSSRYDIAKNLIIWHSTTINHSLLLKETLDKLQDSYKLIECHLQNAEAHQREATSLSTDLDECKDKMKKLEIALNSLNKELHIEKTLHSQSVETWNKQVICLLFIHILIAIDLLHISDLILKLCFFLLGVISLATGKMVPVLARKQEQQKGQRILSIIWRYLNIVKI